MALSFSPVELSDDPRSWKAEIGLLNPDTHAVVFSSINDLVRWLKTLSVDVDSNLTQLRALPRYSQLGKLQAGTTSNAASAVPEAVNAQSAEQAGPRLVNAQPQDQSKNINIHAPPVNDAGFVISPIDGFVPTRRVRERVGGGSAQIASLFGGDEEEAPAQPSRSVSASHNTAQTQVPVSSGPAQASASSDFIPTRKVREAPGGGSAQIKALFG